ncbi:metalloprotease [Corynebacterium sp. zg254]|uniref:Metalloprotease n=1 Tax=Corynebacterium zhongnanshanii TaxID=2768834 RepID=A0ABQ6VGI8_9CORY|nr:MULTISPECIES: neutral zinc metallopeptidase [Corynebacterium]KAB3523433.1 metalloprotease [Corynebacterium zhongnanshanii]MCR5913428.1 metalloprotease [Corynebacterium sp. zg254]
MTFNNNLGNDYGSRGSTGGSGSSGGFGNGFGGGPRRGGGMFMSLLGGMIGRKFGIPGLIIFAIAVFLFSGGARMLPGVGDSGQQTQGRTGAGLEHCKTFEDANDNDDCRILATQESLDRIWGEILPQEAGIKYTRNELTIAEGPMSTGCGRANASETGPFYCPGDNTVYMPVEFFQQLKRMGGSDGPFSQMYVTAHEVGHHIQHLEGTLGLSDYDNPGQDSNAVKIELQADCYAGLWASQADKGPNAVLDPLTQDQVEQAVTTARSIGDDAIQKNSGQNVDPDAWTHGSAEDRVNWFMRGYQGGTMKSCAQDFNR